MKDNILGELSNIFSKGELCKFLYNAFKIFFVTNVILLIKLVISVMNLNSSLLPLTIVLFLVWICSSRIEIFTVRET